MAEWGWTMHEAKDAITNQVLTWNPDYILIATGFNDLAWGINNPQGTLNDAKALIDAARTAKQQVAGNRNIKFVISTVVNRTPIDGLEYIPVAINSYNSLLRSNASGWSLSGSPVAIAELSGYNAAVDSYDGVHPNSRGEWKIAQAFSVPLGTSAFGLVSEALPPITTSNTTNDDVPVSTPTGLKLIQTGDGFNVSWDHSFGAEGYVLSRRDLSDGFSTMTAYPLPIGADSWRDRQLVRGHEYAYQVSSMRGDTHVSPPTAVVSAVANVTTSAAPKVYTVKPAVGSTSVALSWNKPVDTYASTITGYKLLVVDNSLAKPTIVTYPVTSNAATTTYTLSGLASGHSYAFGITSVNTSGDGPMGAMHGAVVGSGQPGNPTLTSARVTYMSTVGGSDQVTVNWTPSSSVASYWFWSKDLSNPTAPYVQAPWPITSGITLGTPGGASHWSFCITATNGTLISAEPKPTDNQSNVPFCKTATPIGAAAMARQSASGAAPPSLAPNQPTGPELRLEQLARLESQKGIDPSMLQVGLSGVARRSGLGYVPQSPWLVRPHK